MNTVAAFVGVLTVLVGTIMNIAAICSGGIDGIEKIGACCVETCDVCEFEECGNFTSSLSKSNCCANTILDSGVSCNTTGEAPCIIDVTPSTCSNGGLGIENGMGTVCCPEKCGVCGGSGCGSIANTTASECCASNIINSGLYCIKGIEAPCILVNDVYTPAPSATLSPTDPPQPIYEYLSSNCSNGLTGVENAMGTVCCKEACGVCGGSGCSTTANTTASECCESNITDSGLYCIEGIEAPCILVNDVYTPAPSATLSPTGPPQPIYELTPSHCSSGLAGVGNSMGTVWCIEAYGVCRESDCDSIPGTNADECYPANIIKSMIYCGNGIDAPCIVLNDTTLRLSRTMAPVSSFPLIRPETSSTMPSPTTTAAPTTTSTEASLKDGESSSLCIKDMIGGIAGALVAVILAITLLWRVRRQWQSVDDSETKALARTGKTTLPLYNDEFPSSKAPAVGSGMLVEPTMLSRLPGVFSPVGNAPVSAKEIISPRVVGLDIDEGKKESKTGETHAMEDKGRTEFLQESEHVLFQMGKLSQQKTSTTSFPDGLSGDTSALVEGGRAKKQTLMDAIQAVVDASHALASRSSVPLITDIAGFLGILVNLSKDVDDNVSGMPKTIQWCRSMLEILDRRHIQFEDLSDAMENLLEEVHDAISELVKLATCFLRKGKLGRVFTSSLYKRRQEAAESALRDALLRLQVGVSFATIREARGTSSGKDRLDAKNSSTSRKERKRRMMEQQEIPQDQIAYMDDIVLGVGGFSSVRLVEYQGNIAAAKVMKFGEVETNPEMTMKIIKMFVSELYAMIDLRSEHVVNVFGAVTTAPGNLVLIMEFMEGGDLRAFLNVASSPLEIKLAHGIASDIAKGMALLHSKNAIHGDLKSPNVLLTRENRAKIADFGTVRTMKEITSMTTQGGGSWRVGTTLKWAAPEVLNDEIVRAESDVYSYGIVVWEIVSRQSPWQDLSLRELLVKVCMGKRPDIPEERSPLLKALMQQCWAELPEDRLTFKQVLANLGED